MGEADPLSTALAVARILEELGVDYVVGGSLASMVHGETRMTRDVDLVADLAPRHVDDLVARLEHAFFCDREAVRERGHFNVFRRDKMLKVNVFVPPAEGFDAERWRRRLRLSLTASPGSEAWVTDPESILLQKLLWYRAGGAVSEQQWRDVLGVLKVQGTSLDRAWLATWAERLAVADLLARALDEAGLAS